MLVFSITSIVISQCCLHNDEHFHAVRLRLNGWAWTVLNGYKETMWLPSISGLDMILFFGALSRMVWSFPTSIWLPIKLYTYWRWILILYGCYISIINIIALSLWRMEYENHNIRSLRDYPCQYILEVICNVHILPSIMHCSIANSYPVEKLRCNGNTKPINFLHQDLPW